MEFYKTIRNIAAVTFLAALPTICEPSCSYSGKKASASEIKTEIKQEAREIIDQIPTTLKTIIEQ